MNDAIFWGREHWENGDLGRRENHGPSINWERNMNYIWITAQTYQLRNWDNLRRVQAALYF